MFDQVSSFVDKLFVPYAEAWRLTCKVFLLCLPFILGFYSMKFLVHLSRYLDNHDD